MLIALALDKRLLQNEANKSFVMRPQMYLPWFYSSEK
jgi:hypothetical protein